MWTTNNANAVVRGRRPVDDGRREAIRAWAAMSGATAVRFQLVRGVAVVTVDGLLDMSAVQPCRAALDVATDCRCPVLVDMEQVAPPVAVSVALLGVMRRYVRARGAAMTLVSLPAPWVRALNRARVRDLYEIAPDSAGTVHRLPEPAPGRTRSAVWSAAAARPA
jgi:hypothetical protein